MPKQNWQQQLQEIGPQLAARAREADREGRFVAHAYALLRDARLFSIAVPTKFGGGGASHAELCDLVRRFAHHCSSTALAYSMHSHLVAATVWRQRQGKGGEPLLKRLADEQVVLLSTGGADLVESSGVMERVEGGYRVRARKIFGSGAPAADLMVTSARYEHPSEGWQVLHFALSMQAEGVRIVEDWDALGMRGSGSHTIEIENAFVPEAAITLARPAGVWHPVWSMIVTVAFPIFLAAYVGVAERARELARERLRERSAGDPLAQAALGEIDTTLLSAQLAWQDMIRSANDYDFQPSTELASRTLAGKTLLARACVETVRKAMAAVGGASFHRSQPFEQLLRDVTAVGYHPLSEAKQALFSGRVALGLEPV